MWGSVEINTSKGVRVFLDGTSAGSLGRCCGDDAQCGICCGGGDIGGGEACGGDRKRVDGVV